MKVLIIGYGWVGRATHKLFPNAYVVDPGLSLYNAPNTNFSYEHNERTASCDIAFIAVPSPYDENIGALDCSVVEEAIAACPIDLIVLRSATNPGFADEMAAKYGKRIVVQPEYLGESPSHPLLSMDSRQFMILGGSPKDRQKVIECYTQVYNANIKIRQLSAYEAEIVKLTENRAVFYKVMQAQELYDACEAHGVDYYTIRDAVYGDDPRFNLWWTFVYPDNRGANSKCIPKDVYAWCAWAESSRFYPQASLGLLKYNDELIK